MLLGKRLFVKKLYATFVSEANINVLVLKINQKNVLARVYFVQFVTKDTTHYFIQVKILAPL